MSGRERGEGGVGGGSSRGGWSTSRVVLEPPRPRTLGREVDPQNGETIYKRLEKEEEVWQHKESELKTTMQQKESVADAKRALAEKKEEGMVVETKG